MSVYVSRMMLNSFLIARRGSYRSFTYINPCSIHHPLPYAIATHTELPCASSEEGKQSTNCVGSSTGQSVIVVLQDLFYQQTVANNHIEPAPNVKPISLH